jgi:hypothetical protein
MPIRTLLLAAAAACAAPAAPAPDDISPARVKAAFSRQILETHRRGAGRYAYDPPPQTLKRRAWGFRFADDLGCRRPAPEDAPFCRLAAPKAWAEEDIDAVGKLLAPLLAGRLARFFEKVKANGFDTMTRETFVTHHDARDGWHRLYYPNSLHDTRQIVIADAQFLPREEPSKPVLHLLAHAFDFGERVEGRFYPSLSTSSEFLRMTGFAPASTGEWTLASMTPAQRAEYFELFAWKNAEALRAQALSAPAERGRAWKAIQDRTEPLASRYGAASFHALLNPYEAFAEWATLVYFDEPKARSLNPELTRWFEEKVLR